MLCAEVIHTDVAVTSSFSCSDPVLNWLYEAYIRTQLDNYHGCVPSDCPHRERLGYTGDGQLTAETAMLLLDTKELYRKWYQDILDSQGKETGHIPHTAPFLGGGGRTRRLGLRSVSGSARMGKNLWGRQPACAGL